VDFGEISDGFLWRDGSKLNPSQQGTMWMMTLPPWQRQLQSFRLFIRQTRTQFGTPDLFSFSGARNLKRQKPMSLQ
jgi:hypothetical protein